MEGVQEGIVQGCRDITHDTNPRPGTQDESIFMQGGAFNTRHDLLCCCTGERAGHAVMGWVSFAWLWLQQTWHTVHGWGHQAWHTVAGWGHQAWHPVAGWAQQAWHPLAGWAHQLLHYLNIAWNWVIGFVTHAYARVKHAMQRP